MVSLLNHKDSENINPDDNNDVNCLIAITGRSVWKNPGFQSAT